VAPRLGGVTFDIEKVHPYLLVTGQGRHNRTQRLGGPALPADHFTDIIGVDADFQHPAPPQIQIADPDIIGVRHDAAYQVLQSIG